MTCDATVSFAGLTCLEQCKALYEAYMMVITGNKRVMVSYGEYSLQYSQANADSLLQAYNTHHAQCPEAKAAGLPDLDPGRRVRRGPPLHGTMRRGRTHL